MEFYKGHDNIQCLQLSQNNCDTGISVIDLSPVTAMEIFFLNSLYSSIDHPEAFDWTVDPANGRANFKLGIIPTIPVGRDSKSELIVYDPSNPNGVVMTNALFIDMKEVS